MCSAFLMCLDASLYHRLLNRVCVFLIRFCICYIHLVFLKCLEVLVKYFAAVHEVPCPCDCRYCHNGNCSPAHSQLHTVHGFMKNICCPPQVTLTESFCMLVRKHNCTHSIVCFFSTGLIPRLSSQHQQLISTSGIVSKLMVHALNAGLTNLVTVYYAQERSYGNRGTQSFVGKNTRRQTLILPTSMRLVQYLKHSLLLVLTNILQNNEHTPISTCTICILLFLPRSTT